MDQEQMGGHRPIKSVAGHVGWWCGAASDRKGEGNYWGSKRG